MSDARYVYAIVRRDTTLPASVTARADSELAMVPWRELAAVTRLTPDDRPPFTMKAVLHHEIVVEAVREYGPALPVRFGTVFRTPESIELALASRYDRLAADLDRLGDKGELSLTALWASCHSERGGESALASARKVPATSAEGARYLMERAAALQSDEELELKARSCARKLDDALGTLAIEQRVSLVPTPRIAIRASYLLDPTHVLGFRAAFEAMRPEQPEFRMLLTGPWPPYSFVGPHMSNQE